MGASDTVTTNIREVEAVSSGSSLVMWGGQAGLGAFGKTAKEQVLCTVSVKYKPENWDPLEAVFSFYWVF